jgi:hypothetical protein
LTGVVSRAHLPGAAGYYVPSGVLPASKRPFADLGYQPEGGLSVRAKLPQPTHWTLPKSESNLKVKVKHSK